MYQNFTHRWKSKAFCIIYFWDGIINQMFEEEIPVWRGVSTAGDHF